MKATHSKILTLFLPCILVAAVTSTTTWFVFSLASKRTKTLTGRVFRGLSVEGMQIHKIDSSSESLERISPRPRCLDYPIISSRLIESPWVGGQIWRPVIQGLSEDEESLPRIVPFNPNWAIEVDNGDMIWVLLISTKDHLARFSRGTRHYYHRISSFPAETLEAAIHGDYASIPGWEEQPDKSTEPTWSASSGRATPSWTMPSHSDSDQIGGVRPNSLE